jgi:hypothetical protein
MKQFHGIDSETNVTGIFPGHGMKQMYRFDAQFEKVIPLASPRLCPISVGSPYSDSTHIGDLVKKPAD